MPLPSDHLMSHLSEQKFNVNDPQFSVISRSNAITKAGEARPVLQVFYISGVEHVSLIVYGCDLCGCDALMNC